MFIHPSGELNYNEFLAQSADLSEARTRMSGPSILLLFGTISFFIFARNFYYSIVLLYNSKRKLAGWCCFFQTFPGIVIIVIGLCGILPNGPSCRAVLWPVAIGRIISADAANVLLFTQAYRAHQRSRWLLAAAIIFIAPTPVSVWVIWNYSYITTTAHAGCTLNYPDYLPWLKFGLDTPINIVFSVAFLMVVVRQYRRSGTACWANLARDGFVTMLLVVASNIFCAFGVAFRILGDLSPTLWVSDW
ncbi:hypothetical protein THASP1DRAFT_28034 [Thamnocephalis sphaerospora]|uniref:Uncharacterized protein n=1 Tax=Thamnocephalis sphaerospora TaxID=78915 RepID=A0A4P9XV93_9FUNG|nr:hypothetical protein THASP1DRAFT_28034 [Thamnocephalis sphaerospora]|eukprot:RKP10194.1 hypothetical protein THASP1DRAFT_28034 [Thamnocephalis sphaerospora]